jgi:hypothetical protein
MESGRCGSISVTRAFRKTLRFSGPSHNCIHLIQRAQSPKSQVPEDLSSATFGVGPRFAPLKIYKENPKQRTTHAIDLFQRIESEIEASSKRP